MDLNRVVAGLAELLRRWRWSSDLRVRVAPGDFRSSYADRCADGAGGDDLVLTRAMRRRRRHAHASAPGRGSDREAEVERERLDHGGDCVASRSRTPARDLERGDVPGFEPFFTTKEEGPGHGPRPGHRLRHVAESGGFSASQRARRGRDDRRAAAANGLALARAVGAGRSGTGRRRHGARAGGRGRARGAALRQRRVVPLRLSDDGGGDTDRSAGAGGQGQSRRSTCCSPTWCYRR